MKREYFKRLKGGKWVTGLWSWIVTATKVNRSVVTIGIIKGNEKDNMWCSVSIDDKSGSALSQRAFVVATLNHVLSRVDGPWPVRDPSDKGDTSNFVEEAMVLAGSLKIRKAGNYIYVY